MMTTTQQPLTLEQAYERYSTQLHAYALRLTKSPERAEDYVQSTFEKAMRYWQSRTDTSERQTRPWLYTILKQLIINDWRRAQCVEMLPILDMDFEQSEDTHHRCELRADIAAALARLTERQREVLLLHDSEGFSCATIAQATRHYPSGIEQALKRARQAFKAAYR